MSNEKISDLIPRVCECGHRSDEHRGLSADCTAPNCNCSQFHEVVTEHMVDKRCTECGREYRCSISKEAGNGICNICMKKIEMAYTGDTMPYLFGWRDDRKSQLYAKKLATTILNANVTIDDLWQFYQANGPNS